MNLQILDTKREVPIEGFTQVPHDQLLALDENVSDNECEMIMAPEIFSYLPYSAYPQVTTELVKKLRTGGTLVIGGTELRAFANAVSNQLMSVEDSNAVIRDTVSMAEVGEVCGLVNQLFGQGYQVSWSCNGVHYEIRIRRA